MVSQRNTEVITESAKLDATHASLRLLVIDGNKVRLRGKCHNSFEELRFLQSKNVKAEFLFECLRMFIYLKYVCVVGCDNVPNEIFPLLLLTILRLLNCKELKQLPDEIGEAELLKELQISGCPIIKLPESFSKLTSLEICEVGGTQLQTLPNGIGKGLSALKKLECCRLQWLQISRLPITDIYCDFKGLTILTALYISSCKKLKKLPDSMDHLHISQIKQSVDSVGNLCATKCPYETLVQVFKQEMVKGNIIVGKFFPYIKA